MEARIKMLILSKMLVIFLYLGLKIPEFLLQCQ